ncbi:protease pro-enzyme activation domain-containing protein [Streptacidiphilus sp. P02-A3a]|uniref:S53 family peptidase n=1 Tax=Streptacidiphilus sp. P02-A3a TaxID=2704468 RepID=UPI0015FC86F3|nr:S53 family serine peptidase [Streptacidiphilus sp. P02-A3a]QMU68169.1 S8 family serine peptidase [Streptacidiphilus sp. P02-A3a]
MRRSWSRSRAGTAALLTIPLLLAGGLGTGPARADGRSAAQPARVPLPDTVPGWTAQAADQGLAATSAAVTARVYLAGQDPAGLAALARAVSDPASPSYGRFLSPAETARRFGAGAGQVAAVRAWLTASGFTVSEANQHYLAVRGNAAAVQRAFATRLHTYRKDGRTYTAPAAAATAPAGVAAAVLAVTGLDTAPHRAVHGSRRAVRGARRDILPAPSAAYVNSGPFSRYFGAAPATGLPQAYGHTQAYVVKGFDGTQLRRAYGADGTGLTGKGVTVAVVDAYDSPTLGSDIARYAAAHGDSPYRQGQLTRVDPAGWTDTIAPSDAFPGGCGAAGWYGEQSLDIEAVHGVAPDADIVYVGGASCQDSDLTDALDRVVDKRLATIVSDSWSDLETATDSSIDAVYDRTFMRGAVEGIGFYFSSGDDGDEASASGGKTVGSPVSLPWVTGVGGTSLAVDRKGGYSFETGWGTTSAPLSRDGESWVGLPGSFLGGAGGGTSTRVPEPFYQYPVVPSALTGANGGRNRVVPDVAAVADSGTGFLVGQTQTWPDGSVRYGEYRVGGTSVACPVFAGVQALAEQAQGSPLGFADPEIYERYNTPAFHDVTDAPLAARTTLAQVRVDYHDGVDDTYGQDVSLRTMGHDSSLHAVKGYDDVTGVGSPAPGYLASFGKGFHGFPTTARPHR